MNKNKNNLRKHTLLLLGLTALPFSPALAEQQESSALEQEGFSLLADNIEYDNTGGTVIASGGVKISSEEGELTGEKLTYNTTAGKMFMKGNVVFTTPDGLTLFLNEMEITDDLKKGALQNLKVHLGKGEHPPTLTADKGEVKEGNLTLHNTGYSPCIPCKDNEKLPWQIRAKEVTYEKDKDRISYKHAKLDVYGVPVFYLPYLHHPVGKQKAHNGLLPPKFGSSTSRGEELTLGYYHRIDDGQDLTFRTRFMSNRGTMLMAEQRHANKHSNSDIRASFIEDDKADEMRSHVDAKAEYVFEAGKRMGINAQVASDDTYLDDYFDRNPSYLPSTLYAENASEDHYYAAQATFYHDLREEQASEETAQVLPNFTAEKTFSLNEKGHNLKLSADFLALHRSEGTRMRRLVTEAAFNAPYLTTGGHKWDIGANLRADAYNVDAGTQGADGMSYRVLPELYASWEMPLESEGGHHVITPKLMSVLSPRGGNPLDIPNEDSVAYELDRSNLFSTNRFAGMDRVETGSRLIYGMDNHWRDDDGQTRYRIFLGQTYRAFEDTDLPTLGGTENKLSDWVGYAELHPHKSLTLTSNFRVDNADWEAKRMDNSFTLGNTKKSYLNLSHTFLDGGADELHAVGRWELNRNFALEGEVRKDLLDDGKLLLSEGTLSYTQHCYKLSFTARRRGFDNRNVPPSTDYLFNIELLTLGRED